MTMTLDQAALCSSSLPNKADPEGCLWSAHSEPEGKLLLEGGLVAHQCLSDDTSLTLEKRHAVTTYV